MSTSPPHEHATHAIPSHPPASPALSASCWSSATTFSPPCCPHGQHPRSAWLITNCHSCCCLRLGFNPSPWPGLAWPAAAPSCGGCLLQAACCGCGAASGGGCFGSAKHTAQLLLLYCSSHHHQAVGWVCSRPNCQTTVLAC